MDTNHGGRRMSRVQACLLFALLLLAFPAWSDLLHYKLDVKGMACAFCAYNATQRLAELPGVERESVRLDPRNGAGSLISQAPLERTTVARVLEDAGFRLISLQQVDVPISAPQGCGAPAVTRYEFASNSLSEASAALSAIGDRVAEEGGHLKVSGPKELEKAVVRALVMGKKAVVPVVYSASADAKIHVQWLK